MSVAATIDELHHAVRTAWTRRESRLTWLRLLTALSIAIGAFLVLTTVESVTYLPPVAKVIGWVLIIATGVASGWELRRRLPSTPFDRAYPQIAEAIEKPAIRYALDLHLNRGEHSPKLQDASIAQLMQELPDAASAELKEYDKKHPYRTGMILAGFTVVNLAVLIALFGVYDGGALQRITSPLERFAPPNPFEFAVEPGDATLEQGLPLPVVVRFEGDAPKSVVLALKSPEETGYRRFPMREEDGAFRYDTDPLFTDHRYVIEMDGHASPEYTATVSLLPRFTSLVVTVVPPAHTGLRADSIPYPIPSLQVQRGSELRFKAVPNVPLRRVEMVTQSGTRLDLLQSTRFRVMADDSLWFELTDEAGLANRNPFSIPVTVIEDVAPTVNWIDPAVDVALAEARPVELIWDMRDDFGISSVVLNTSLKREFAQGVVERAIPIRGPHPAAGIGTYRLDLASFEMRPMDELTVHLDVTDNDAVSGRKTTRSEPRIIRIASMAELLAAEDEMENEAGNALAEIERQAEENRKQLEELRQDLIDNPRNRAEQMRNADQMQQQREALEEQVRELQKELEEMKAAGEESRSLSEETRELYEQLEKLAEELNDPDLARAMEELQKALEEMDPNQVRQAVENLEFNEQRFKERIERTMELFKQLKTRAELDRMAAQLEQLEQLQEQLKESGMSPEETEQRQQDAAQQLEQMQERIEQLDDNAPRRMKEKMEQLSEELQQDADQAEKTLDEQLEELEKEAPSRPTLQQQQEQLQQQFNRMKSKVQEAGASMKQEQVQLNTQALLGIMQQLLLISDAQEGLLQTTSNLTQGSAGFVDAARQQLTVNRIFSQVADSLFELSKQVPEFSNEINDKKRMVQRNAQSALRELSERDRARALAEERFMLAGMNEIGSMLADLLEQLQDPNRGGGEGGGGSGQGMGEGMEPLGKGQQQLNQQLQDLLNDMAGNRLMQDGTQRLDQMARQQNELRKQLEELRRNGGLEPGDPLLKELEQLNQDMEDAVNDLRGGAVDRVMVQRQQNILSRMLEVEKAFQERDEDDQRKGEEADPIRGIPPAELTPQQMRDRIRDILNDPNFTRYTEEYQRLIQRYFELIEKEP